MHEACAKKFKQEAKSCLFPVFFFSGLCYVGTVSRMHVGSTYEVIAAEKFAWGIHGERYLGIPPFAMIRSEITLVGVHNITQEEEAFEEDLEL